MYYCLKGFHWTNKAGFNLFFYFYFFKHFLAGHFHLGEILLPLILFVCILLLAREWYTIKYFAVKESSCAANKLNSDIFNYTYNSSLRCHKKNGEAKDRKSKEINVFIKTFQVQDKQVSVFCRKLSDFLKFT